MVADRNNRSMLGNQLGSMVLDLQVEVHHRNVGTIQHDTNSGIGYCWSVLV